MTLSSARTSGKWKPVPDPPADSAAPEADDLNPAALLARALDGIGRLRGNSVPWQPLSVEELQRQLPEYEIIGIAGQGGMGAVYKGRQRSLDRLVAIKVLPPGIAADDLQYRERFKREGRAMAQLRHPGIVAVHDAGETADGLLYFVMEFVDGREVSDLLRDGARIAPEEAMRIAAKVCEALACAHERGVIHRDIKPANVMIETDGTVKVADFGLARVAASEADGLTRSDLAFGTPDFIAPEALVSSTDVDARADLYAVGVMLYHMLTGQLPRGRFAPPSEVVPGLDKSIDRVVDRALQPDRTRRHSSAIELRAEIDSVLARRIAARAGSMPPNRRPARKWLLIGGAAIMVFSLGGWIIWKNLPPPGRTDAITPASATVERPFVNSLGMKFVPVPILRGSTGGTRVLFSVWETRVQDYQVFASATGRPWPKPNFEQGPTHPAVRITWDEARAFCDWLTERERKDSRIGANEAYRLPTDYEWSCAVGIGDREDPARKFSKNGVTISDVYPWGTAWPPPPGAGNFRDRTTQQSPEFNKDEDSIPGYDDGYVWTAPIGSYTPNVLGLYDLSGNAWEWCEDTSEANPDEHVLRGGAYWCGVFQLNLNSSVRLLRSRNWNNDDLTFRAVLSARKEGAGPRTAPGGESSPAEMKTTSPETTGAGQWVNPITDFSKLTSLEELKDGWVLLKDWEQDLHVSNPLSNQPVVLRNGGVRARRQVPGDWHGGPVLTVRNIWLQASRRVELHYYPPDSRRTGGLLLLMELCPDLVPSNPTPAQEMAAHHSLVEKEISVIGTEFSSELIAVAKLFIGCINGETIACTVDDRDKSGQLTLFSVNKYPFRDVEILNLDGLSDADALKPLKIENP